MCCAVLCCAVLCCAVLCCARTDHFVLPFKSPFILSYKEEFVKNTDCVFMKFQFITRYRAKFLKSADSANSQRNSATVPLSAAIDPIFSDKAVRMCFFESSQ